MTVMLDNDPVRELDGWPLFHWSPIGHRASISRRGLRPGMLSLDRAWRPPYVALAEDPRLAWELSGDLHPELSAWDLWMVASDELTDGAEALVNYDGERWYVQEWRTYAAVPARLLWHVATRRECNQGGNTGH